MINRRAELAGNVKRVLVKVGSAVLTGKDGLDLVIIQQLADELAQLSREGRQVVLVSSGAIASGKQRMGITAPLKSIPQKQAAAAIGQSRLMRVYSNAFGRHNILTAQILLTMSDLVDRRRFLNIKNTLLTLRDWGVLAIINENDTVAVDEIKFGDNDNLSAMIANIIEAQLLINLTSAEGLYDRDPSLPDARLIPLVEEITPEIEAVAAETGTAAGTGGMKSKVMAAKKITAFGIPCIIAPGKRPGVITDIFAGREVGTLFLPNRERQLKSRKYWIAFTLRSRGKIIIDAGAKKAIIEEGKSLLPSGIIAVEGDFAAGDPVTCVDQTGLPMAKGLTNYSSEETGKIMGLKTSRIEQVLGYKDYDEVIHRDNLAVIKR